MARFIEVAPINYGGGEKKMLINVEKNRLRSTRK